MVSAKSGINFERAMSRRRGITLRISRYNQPFASLLFDAKRKGEEEEEEGGGRGYKYQTRATSIQTSPNIHPSVTSPRNTVHPRSNSILIAFPAANALKVIRISAAL